MHTAFPERRNQMTLLILGGSLLVWLLAGATFWFAFVGGKLRFKSRRETIPVARPILEERSPGALMPSRDFREPTYPTRRHRAGMLN